MEALPSIGLQVIALDFLRCRTRSRKSCKSGHIGPSNSDQRNYQQNFSFCFDCHCNDDQGV